jgi:hypothetical protein
LAYMQDCEVTVISTMAYMASVASKAILGSTWLRLNAVAATGTCRC